MPNCLFFHFIHNTFKLNNEKNNYFYLASKITRVASSLFYFNCNIRLAFISSEIMHEIPCIRPLLPQKAAVAMILPDNHIQLLLSCLMHNNTSFKSSFPPKRTAVYREGSFLFPPIYCTINLHEKREKDEVNQGCHILDIVSPKHFYSIPNSAETCTCHTANMFLKWLMVNILW